MMTANTFNSILPWRLIVFFSLTVLLLIHPVFRRWMFESRDLPSKRSRISSSISDLIELIFYPIFW